MVFITISSSSFLSSRLLDRTKSSHTSLSNLHWSSIYYGVKDEKEMGKRWYNITIVLNIFPYSRIIKCIQIRTRLVSIALVTDNFKVLIPEPVRMYVYESMSANPLMTVTTSVASTPRNSSPCTGVSLLFMRNEKSLETASGINKNPRATHFLSSASRLIYVPYEIRKTSCLALIS